MAIVKDERASFGCFVADIEPRLRRALTVLRGSDQGREATAEALAWAWENWAKLQDMANPVGYLYRVGSSRTRRRTRGFASGPPGDESSRFEPGLGPALARLSQRQRSAVVLVHGCGWTYQEVADALNVSKSSVGTHVARGMVKLRIELGAHDNG